MQQNLQKKRGLVKKVFDNVYNKYDLMNDFMSLGVHRQWKRELIRQMNPYPESALIDVACGTGDIAKLYADKNAPSTRPPQHQSPHTASFSSMSKNSAFFP